MDFGVKVHSKLIQGFRRGIIDCVSDGALSNCRGFRVFFCCDQRRDFMRLAGASLCAVVVFQDCS